MLRHIVRLLRSTRSLNEAAAFDAAFYRSVYPDVQGDPLTHWRRKGRGEGRLAYMPAGLPPFDPDYYLSRYRDVANAGDDPFHHWLRIGRLEGRATAWPADAEGHAPALRTLIEAHGLFSRDFYLANYAEDIPAGIDPLDHYITIGQHRGLKPNPAFDPLIYLVRRPDARHVGPLLHYLERLNKGEVPDEDLSTTSVFPAVRYPEVMLNVDSQAQSLKDRDLEEGLAQSQLFGDEQVLEFVVDEKAYRLVAPSADEFFDRVRDDRPFALSRLPHGFWDCLLELRTAKAQVAEAVAQLAPEIVFSEDEIARMAERACHGVMSGMAVFEENFLRELLGEVVRNETGPDHLRSVSFKWQPTIDNRVFGRTDIIGVAEEGQLRDFATYFTPDMPVFEAMIWKRWVYSGHVTRLATEARDRPVVLVGAERVASLGERLQMPWFSQVEIHLSSYHIRYDVLERCKAAVREAKALAEARGLKRPLIMFQGGSFAYWVIARLHKWDPSVFYVDFGQALHIWFLDNRELWTPWLMFHPRLVMENCGLDEFYRDLGIEPGEPFSLPHPA